jgi:hypothetical protein
MIEHWKYPVARTSVRAFVLVCCVSISIGHICAQQLSDHQPRSFEVGVKTLRLAESDHTLQSAFTLMKMTGTEQHLCQNFFLRNVSNAAVTITDIELRSEDAGIGVTSVVGAELPVVVEPQGTVTVRLRYISPDHRLRNDTLVLTREDGSSMTVPIGANIDTTDADQLGLGRREITMTVTSSAINHSISVNLYRYVGNIAIYTKSGTLVDIAKNVRSYIWHATRGKKFYDENEYVVKATSTDGGYSFSRTEHVLFASQ